MIDRECNIDNPSDVLMDFVHSNESEYQMFRRRAVIGKRDGKTSILICVVEAIPVWEGGVSPESSKEYTQIILFEDQMNVTELSSFIGEVSQGFLKLGQYTFEATDNSGWERKLLPLKNNCMNRAGQIYTKSFERNCFGITGALIAPKQPYYPDSSEAMRHWLPFTEYDNNTDSRNGKVLILLPETRAYFSDVLPDEDGITAVVKGAFVGKKSLIVKGAWWEGQNINHFSIDVQNGCAKWNLPREVSRLEYILIDDQGNLYDFQLEGSYGHTGLGGRLLKNSKGDAAVVRQTLRSGEGVSIEFKPFIDPKNKKMSEIFRTVTAFANSSGGCIYLGIDDDCTISGIDEDLSKWSKSSVDGEVCNRYLGELRSRIRDEVVGDFDMNVKQVSVDKRLVAIVDVKQAKTKPIYIRQEKVLYVRRGASNTKASPEEWTAILCYSKSIASPSRY